MDDITDSMDVSLSELREMVMDREAWRAASWGRKESDMTYRLHKNNIRGKEDLLPNCKEIQPVHSEGDQPWDFFGRNDAKAATPVLWPPHAKS